MFKFYYSLTAWFRPPGRALCNWSAANDAPNEVDHCCALPLELSDYVVHCDYSVRDYTFLGSETVAAYLVSAKNKGRRASLMPKHRNKADGTLFFHLFLFLRTYTSDFVLCIPMNA